MLPPLPYVQTVSGSLLSTTRRPGRSKMLRRVTSHVPTDLYGWGNATTGGGPLGRVFLIRSLKDSGAGTLREVCEAEGPRIGIAAPDLAGKIRTDSTISIQSGDLTLIGNDQALEVVNNNRTNDLMQISSCSNIYMSNWRLRPGAASSGSLDSVDSLSITGSENIYLSRMSYGASVDEAVSIAGASRYITFYRNLFGPPIDDGHSSGPHAYGLFVDLAGTSTYGYITVLESIFASIRFRNPLVFCATPFEVVNCLYHDCTDIATLKTTGGSVTKLNFVGNRITNTGPNTRGNANIAIVETSATTGTGTRQAYLADNSVASGIATKNESNGAIDIVGTPFETRLDYDNLLDESTLEATLPALCGALPLDTLDTGHVARIAGGYGGNPLTNDQFNYPRFALRVPNDAEPPYEATVDLNPSTTSVTYRGRFRTSDVWAGILGCWSTSDNKRQMVLMLDGDGYMRLSASEDGSTDARWTVETNFADGEWHTFEASLTLGTPMTGQIIMDSPTFGSGSPSTTTDTGSIDSIYDASADGKRFHFGGRYYTTNDKQVDIADCQVLVDGVVVFQNDFNLSLGDTTYSNDEIYTVSGGTDAPEASTLKHHWDFSDAESVTVEADYFEAVNDLAGNSHLVGRRITRTIGTGVGYYNDADDVTRELGFDNGATLDDFTIYAVVQSELTGFETATAIIGEGGNWRIGVTSEADGGFRQIHSRLNGSNHNSDVTPTTALHVLAWVRSGTDLKVFLDGVQQGTTTTVSDASFTPDTFGGRGGSDTQQFTGVISEVKIFNEAKSDGDVLSDSTTLKSKWS